MVLSPESFRGGCSFGAARLRESRSGGLSHERQLANTEGSKARSRVKLGEGRSTLFGFSCAGGVAIGLATGFGGGSEVRRR
jgi:hypothetical protein